MSRDDIIKKTARHLRLSIRQASEAISIAGYPSSIIGKGGFAIVFTSPDDPTRIVKITTDHSDGRVCEMLAANKNPWLLKVYRTNLVDIAGGLYIIEAEKLTDIFKSPKHVLIAMNDILAAWSECLENETDVIRHMYASHKKLLKRHWDRIRYRMAEMARLLLSYSDDYMTDSDSVHKDAARVLEGAARSISEMIRLDILTPDIHPVNWGYREVEDRVIPLDFGTLSTHSSEG